MLEEKDKAGETKKEDLKMGPRLRHLFLQVLTGLLELSHGINILSPSNLPTQSSPTLSLSHKYYFQCTLEIVRSSKSLCERLSQAFFTTDINKQ